MTLINSAQSGLATAVAALDTANPTAAQITAANEAITLLANALAAANDLSPNQTQAARAALASARTTVTAAQATLQTGMETAARVQMQMAALENAQTALATALAGDDLVASNAAYAALETAIGAGADLTTAQKAAAVTALNMADVTIAKAELVAAEADATATGATLEQMLAAYRAKLAAAQRLAAASAASAADLATANQAIGMATAKIAELQEDIQDAADDAADAVRVVNNAKAMQVAKAINAHKLSTATGAPATPAELVRLDTTPTGGTNFGVSRISGSTKFALTQSAADRANKAFTTGAAPNAGTGWSGMTFMRSGTAAKKDYKEMVAVYTDIEMAEDVLWATAFDSIDNLSEENGLVTISTSASVDAQHFTGGILPVGPTGNDDTSTVNLKAGDAQGRAGTFYGVSGRFTCASDCIVSRNKAGKVSVNQALTFTPNAFNANTTLAKYADPDADYTRFGYWMKSTKQRDGSYVHDIRTFNGGEGANLATLTEVRGTAKYYGAAAGVYVKKDGAGDSLVVTDGKFTADAMLTANFGGNAIASDNQYTVSGTISDFMDGSTDLEFAVLKLNKTSITSTGATGGAAAAGTAGTLLAETDGGGTSGLWSAQFYGNAGAGTTDDGTDDHPANVSGQFNGHFTNGHVAGAFGAEKD